MIWSEKSEVRQVRSNARRWFLGKFFCYGFRREKFSSLNPNLNTARLKVERKIYHAAKYNSFLFCFVLDRTWGELLGSKLTANMAGKGNREQVPVSFCFSFLFFFFYGVSCVNLTWLVTSEVINDCNYFFSFQYVVDVNQLYHLNKHLWIMLLTTLTMNRKGVNRKMKEKWIESFNLLIPAKTVCSDNGKKSFFSGNRNGLSAILGLFHGNQAGALNPSYLVWANYQLFYKPAFVK